MKLLSPSIRKDTEESERQLGLLRMQEQQKEANRIRKELANAEADFKAVLAKNRTQWAKEEQDHEDRIMEMKKEVAELEDRKAQALIPVKMYEAQAHQYLEQAQEALKTAHRREKDADALNDLLQDKLDAVGQKEQDLSLLEATLTARQAGIEQQTEQVQDGVKSLNKEMQGFARLKEAIEADLREKRIALTLKERSLSAKEKKLERKEESLTALATQLEDERGTLDRAWKELKKLSP